MDCLLCYKVYIKEKEFENYSRNPQLCKKAILKLFGICDTEVQGLSEDLVICLVCQRKLEGTGDLVTQLVELQRSVDQAKIEIKQGLMYSKKISEVMAKNIAANRMSQSSQDRLILLKAIEKCHEGAAGHKTADHLDDSVQPKKFKQSADGSEMSDSQNVSELERAKLEREKAIVYLMNIPKSYTEEKVKELFDRFGAIKSSKIFLESNGKAEGGGYVAFDDPKSAEEAVKEMNGRVFKGKILFARINKKSSYGSPKAVAEMKRRFAGKKPLHMPLTQRDNDEDEYLSSPNMRVVKKSNIRSPLISPVYSPTGSDFKPSTKQSKGEQLSPTPRRNTPGIRPQSQGFGFQSPSPPARVSASERLNDQQKQKIGKRIFPLIHEKCQNFAVSGKVTEMLLKDYAKVFHLLEDRSVLDPLVEEALVVIRKEETKSLAQN